MPNGETEEGAEEERKRASADADGDEADDEADEEYDADDDDGGGGDGGDGDEADDRHEADEANARAARAPGRSAQSTESMRRTLSYIGIGTGVVLFGLGLYLLVATKSPGPMGVGFVLGGFTGVLTSYYTLLGSRVAWAFSCAQHAIFAVAFLFGAPSIETATGASIWIALLPCASFATMSGMLITCGTELR